MITSSHKWHLIHRWQGCHDQEMQQFSTPSTKKPIPNEHLLCIHTLANTQSKHDIALIKRGMHIQKYIIKQVT